MSSTESKKLPAGAPGSKSISAAHPRCSPGLWNNKSGFFSFPPSRTNLSVMKMSTASYCLHPACRKQRPRSPLSPSTLRFRAQSPPGPGGSQKSSCMGMGNPWGTCFLQQHRMSQLRANPKAPLVLWESPGTLWHRSDLPKTWFRGEFPSGQLPARRTEGLPHGAACASPEDPSPEPGRCWLHVGLTLLRVMGPWDAPHHHHHGSGETKKRLQPFGGGILISGTSSSRRGSQEISSSSLRRV